MFTNRNFLSQFYHTQDRKITTLTQFTGEKIIAVSGNTRIDQSRLLNKKVITFKGWGKHFIICFINGWKRVNPYDLTFLKKMISGGKPVIFSIRVDEGFDKTNAPFIWKERCGIIEQTHTMVIAGYDDGKKAFLIMNSWGTSWGDRGFIWIDYQFFLRNVLPDGYILI